LCLISSLSLFALTLVNEDSSHWGKWIIGSAPGKKIGRQTL
jgi:hypothetical protein